MVTSYIKHKKFLILCMYYKKCGEFLMRMYYIDTVPKAHVIENSI